MVHLKYSYDVQLLLTTHDITSAHKICPFLFGMLCALDSNTPEERVNRRLRVVAVESEADVRCRQGRHEALLDGVVPDAKTWTKPNASISEILVKLLLRVLIDDCDIRVSCILMLHSLATIRACDARLSLGFQDTGKVGVGDAWRALPRSCHSRLHSAWSRTV